MHFVVVTGAGASREFGRSAPLPLMTDWARALIAELETREVGLAQAAGLSADMDSESFEETIGALLRWGEMRSLNTRFAGLGGSQPGGIYSEVQRARQAEGERLSEITDAINVSLYRLFGSDAIRDELATEGYRRLLEALSGPSALTIVTTNYDPCAEIALDALGRAPKTGFRRPPGRAPVLDSTSLEAMGPSDETSSAVLHLHGAVGWYERDGVVREHPQDQPYNATLGRPVVLYPDPDKDPTRDAVVAGIWHQFDVAIETADAVVVLGHSLHDPALTAKLAAAASQTKVCVAVYNSSKTEQGELSATAIEAIPGCAVVGAKFGPEPELQELHAWIQNQVIAHQPRD